MFCNIYLFQTYWKCEFQEGVFRREFGRKTNRTYLTNLTASPGMALRLAFIFLVHTNALYVLSIPSLEIP